MFTHVMGTFGDFLRIFFAKFSIRKSGCLRIYTFRSKNIWKLHISSTWPYSFNIFGGLCPGLLTGDPSHCVCCTVVLYCDPSQWHQPEMGLWPMAPSPLHSAVLYGDLAPYCCTLLYCTVLYCTLLYRTDRVAHLFMWPEIEWGPNVHNNTVWLWSWCGLGSGHYCHIAIIQGVRQKKGY